jgi:hypothetical protein
MQVDFKREHCRPAVHGVPSARALIPAATKHENTSTREVYEEICAVIIKHWLLLVINLE